MRNSQSVINFKYFSQNINEDRYGKTITTILKNDKNHEIHHKLVWQKGYGALEVYNTFVNNDNIKVTLEMLSSFSLTGITPFEVGDTPESLLVHRIRSCWSAEGRLDTSSVEDLQLEPSWGMYGIRCEKFGQVGSMPVRKFFPFVAVEDKINHVLWGVQLAHGASWQMEICRVDDALSLSGGLADREFGHWVKNVQPGENFTTPKAVISVAEGNIDVIANRLTQMQNRPMEMLPETEKELPIIFNEFCTTWGKPSYDNIKELAESLKGKGIKYFVIDAGWYAQKGRKWDFSMGDWRPCVELFPEGIEKAVEVIRECGMIPGIWFEFEVCGRYSDAFHNTDHQLKRDGFSITSGDRRFWDMRDSFVIEYLSKHVIEFIKKYGFEYLKIDYNDSIGIGCDGAESQGEGLRQHIASTQNFIKKIRAEIPNIVLENCSSGGHRLEPSMMAITSMSSFSDAHECIESPIIAANLHRVILPRQSQVWAVLRKRASEKRLVYTMVGTFLGRMCLSGDIVDLSEIQWDIIKKGIDFYNKIASVIKNGFSYRFGPKVKSYRHPKGWQAILRVSTDKKEIVAIIHSFEGEAVGEIQIQLPSNYSYRIEDIYTDDVAKIFINEDKLVCNISEEFKAIAVYIKISL
ncbi:glycoside hydrolase family 36 protein [Clostridium lacusfryxellense]|uniref:glycoside hydrolase family 36 protein n=1 Tax=Clostridium lacusfryxellense TaxID=205328 RepID=UPI001FE37474|nr:alpha-galactosidase [Clostridium lacusfryxellense]